MFSFLSYWLYESCDLFPVQVALWTLGQLVASTGYVVEPYRKYPTLLEVLLNFLKTEQNQGTRREVGSLSDIVFTDLLEEWREWEMFAVLIHSSGVDETSSPFPLCPCSWERDRSVREHCFVVVRCCDECFPFPSPLPMQAIRVLGLLGALDPYKHKVNIGMIDQSRDASAVSLSESKSSQDSCKLRGPVSGLPSARLTKPSLAVFRKSLVLENYEIIPHWFTW